MKQLRPLALASGVLACASLALAHDYWVEPTVWRPKAGDLVALNLVVGHAGERDVRPREAERIERFFVSQPAVEGLERATADVPGAEGRAPAGYLRCERSGLYAVGYRSRNSTLELEAAKFEAYLAEEGLEHVLEERAKRGERESPGREAFSRCAKSLLVVGDGPSAGFNDALGLTLEIVPLDDPFELAPGKKLRVRVLYRGEAFEGLLLEAEPLGGTGENKLQARSDEHGIATFALADEEGASWAGRWLIAGVHMRRADPGLPHDWESLWASLTFEVGAS